MNEQTDSRFSLPVRMRKHTTRLSLQLCAGLLWLSLFACCADLPGLELGGLRVKAVLPIFFLMPLVLITGGMRSFRSNIIYTLSIVFALFTPSILFSKYPGISAAFLVGLLNSFSIVISAAIFCERLGYAKTTRILLNFYRLTIIASAVMVALGIQDRAHFTFYEPAYFAIALIPYFSIYFLSNKKTKWDLALIVLAIASSASASMLAYAGLCWLISIFRASHHRLRRIVSLVFVIFLAATVLPLINQRASLVKEGVVAAIDDPAAFANVAVFVSGNRLQRILVAYEAFTIYPITGVGMGALKEYSSQYFNKSDFSIDGISAGDFIIESNAANVYVELLAEAGIIGLAGYIFLLRRVWKSCSFDMIALRTAFFVTCAALLLESSYMRPYVWLLYGIIFGIYQSQKAIPATKSPRAYGASQRQKKELTSNFEQRVAARDNPAASLN